MLYPQPPRCCFCAACPAPPQVFLVTFSGVGPCPSGLCADWAQFNQTHEIRHHAACVWAANGPIVYEHGVLNQIDTLPGCNGFLVRVMLTRNGNLIHVSVVATSGSAAHAEWAKDVPVDEFDCEHIGDVPLLVYTPCYPTVYIDFSGASCRVC